MLRRAPAVHSAPYDGSRQPSSASTCGYPKGHGRSSCKLARADDRKAASRIALHSTLCALPLPVPSKVVAHAVSVRRPTSVDCIACDTPAARLLRLVCRKRTAHARRWERFTLCSSYAPNHPLSNIDRRPFSMKARQRRRGMPSVTHGTRCGPGWSCRL